MTLRRKVARLTTILFVAVALASVSALALRQGGHAQAAVGSANNLIAVSEEPAAGQLVSCSVNTAPLLDGEADPVWASCPTLRIPLTYGIRGEEHAVDVGLRSLHDEDTLYLLVDWQGDAPSMVEGHIQNRLTLHFDLEEPWPGARDVTCLVACHTAYTDGMGRIDYLSAETIPSGRTEPLPAAGGWSDGVWRVEWSRPLVHGNLFDVQFEDLEQAYPFFVKVFDQIEDKADPVSARHVLVFRP